ncbi:MAG: HAD-IC family P-type ATPase [Candidatus Pacebacteria bacterium]|nr:HAD-IC family P-type ATPase [Candidatus Paceibacterota bacterium]
MQNKDWHNMDIKEVLDKVGSSKEGLVSLEISKRIKKYGKNELPQKKRFTYLGIALEQFKSPMVYILLAAAFVSALLSELIDAGVILFAVFLNSVVGFMQEIKAEQALEALSSMVRHKAYALRDGLEKEIDAVEVTVGDMLVLKSGDRIPADARIIEVNELEIDEAVLTGESAPVKKTVKGLDKEGFSQSKKNMAYMGSSVVHGRGLAVVVAIGKQTKFGQIAQMLSETKEEDTPLQIQLGRFSNSFGKMTFIVLAIVMMIGLYQGISFIDIFMTSVAIAVAAIPEGVLVAVTIILAIGMQRISKKGSLVRKLIAAETLGSVSIICTDKTGTLTKGKMQVNQIVTLKKTIPVNNHCEKRFVYDDKYYSDHLTALRIGMICNDAVVENPGEKIENWVIHGGYTEKAFLWASMCAGLNPSEINKKSPRINEIPFSSDRKFMATLNREENGLMVYAKGAAEEIIARSEYILVNGKIEHIGEEELKFLKQKQKEMSREGLRVLGVAFKETDKSIESSFKESNDENIINNLVFVALIALKDPLREEAKKTIELAKEAGIRTVMITGDNSLTAKAIANELGMKVDDNNILEGEQLDQMSTKDFNNIVGKIKVYARVFPRHKSRIIDAWQSKGEVVAMTGDGVNDAPALKKADIGVALGSGTEVAKETADVVLLDDNFSTIIMAVEQGRVIFENIRKVILYLISDSFSEVVVVGGSLLLGIAIPVTAAQILWINLITDGLPDIALTLEPGEKGIMKEKPRKKNEPLLNREMKVLVVAISLISGISALVIFYFVYNLTGDFQRASTIAFSVLSIDSLIYVFNIRSLRVSIFSRSLFSNPYLILAVVVAFLFQCAAIYHPFLQNILETKSLGALDWEIVIASSVFTAAIAEFIKIIYINKGKKN